MNELLKNRDVSLSTIRHYERQLPDFKRFLDTNGFNEDTFLAYKRWLSSRTDISVATKNQRLYAVKVVLKEAHRQGQLPNITEGIKGFREPKGHKKVGFSDDQIKQIFKDIPDKRLAAMLHLLAYQGLRQQEIVNMDVSDITNKTALIKGKGMDGKELIHLHPKTVAALEVYLSDRKDGPLFVNQSLNGAGRLTTRGLRTIVTKYLQSKGIKGNLHGFRHWFVTRLVKKAAKEGKSLFWVREHTRHKSLETLKCYYDELELTDDLPAFYAALD